MVLRRALDLPLVLTMAEFERACGQARQSTPLCRQSQLPRRGGKAEARRQLSAQSHGLP